MLTLKEAFKSKLQQNKNSSFKEEEEEEVPNIEDIRKEFTIIIADYHIITYEDILNKIPYFDEIVSKKRLSIFNIEEDGNTIEIINDSINYYALKAIIKYFSKECKSRYLLSSLSSSSCTVEMLFETMKTLSIYFDFTIYELPWIEDKLREILNKKKGQRKRVIDDARDMVFHLIYSVHLKQFDGRDEEAKVYNLVIFIQSHPKEFGRRLRANVWNYYNRHYITTPTRTENFNSNFELLKTTDNNSNSDVSEIENEDDSDSDKDL